MTKLHADLEALMPVPFATMHDDGYWTMKPGTEPHESRYVGWRQEVFTADQVREAMQAATERAARICDGLVYALDNGGNRYRREADASKCAAAIRAASMHEGGGKRP